MLIRLAASANQVEDRRSSGVFVHAYRILRNREDFEIDDASFEELEEVVRWFERNLPVPRGPRMKESAVFWFKAEAGEVVRRIWRLVEILESLGFWVEMLKTTRPGHRVYEDEYQVAAVPYRDTLGREDVPLRRR